MTILSVLAAVCFATISPSKTFKKMNGEWAGQLIYRDYSSEKMISIPANILIRQINDSTWIFEYGYPNEPHANNSDTALLSNAGQTWNKFPINSIRKVKTAHIIITEGNIDDDGITKFFRYTYKVNKNMLTIQKEEKSRENDNYFIRNTYQLTRSKN